MTQKNPRKRRNSEIPKEDEGNQQHGLGEEAWTGDPKTPQNDCDAECYSRRGAQRHHKIKEIYDTKP